MAFIFLFTFSTSFADTLWTESFSLIDHASSGTKNGLATFTIGGKDFVPSEHIDGASGIVGDKISVVLELEGRGANSSDQIQAQKCIVMALSKLNADKELLNQRGVISNTVFWIRFEDMFKSKLIDCGLYTTKMVNDGPIF